MNRWQTEQQSYSELSLILQGTQEVIKLATVEQEFTEIVSHEQFNYYNWNVLKGKLIFKVTGRVAAGYDIANGFMELDSANKLVILNIPKEASILYLESDVSYYDIQEGLFFEFDERDYTEIQKKAKSTIQKAALDSKVLRRAEDRMNHIISNLEKQLNHVGWKLKRRTSEYIPMPLR